MPEGSSWSHAVLLPVLRGQAPPPGLLEGASEDDWDRLARAAAHHGVQGLLAAGLRSSAAPPAAFRVNLQASAIRMMASRENHLRSAAAALGALGDAGVEAIVLKGPAVAERYYPDPAVRPYSDVDLLIRAGELRRGVEALERGGFQLGDRNWDLLVGDLRGQLHLLRERCTTIELHWHVINGARQRRTLRVSTRDLEAAAVPWEVAGRPCRALPPEAEVPYLCLHAALHGGAYALWLVDLGMIARGAEVDWDVVLERLRAWRVSRAGLLVLELARRFVEPSIPAFTQPRSNRLALRLAERWDLGDVAASGAFRKLLVATGGDDAATTAGLLKDALVPPAPDERRSWASGLRRASWDTVRRIRAKLRDEEGSPPEFAASAGGATRETYLSRVEAYARAGGPS